MKGKQGGEEIEGQRSVIKHATKTPAENSGYPLRFREKSVFLQWVTNIYHRSISHLLFSSFFGVSESSKFRSTALRV